MNDILLSGLLNLFALFGAVNSTDKQRSLRILTSYMTKHFGVRILDDYLSLYSDLRDYYDEFPELDKDAIIIEICSGLKSRITEEDRALMLLRLMEFCDPTPGTETGDNISGENLELFRKVSVLFKLPEDIFGTFVCYVSGTVSDKVLTLHRDGLRGELRLIYLEKYNKIVFSYHGPDTVLMNDIPVLPGTFMIWQHSGVLKSRNMIPLYYSNILSLYSTDREKTQIVLAGNGINFRYPHSNNGIHNFSFSLRSGQLVAVMGGSGAGKSTLLSLLNGTTVPDSGTITLNGHSISRPEVKDLLGFVPQDDLLIEDLTVFENLMFTARFCFADKSREEIAAKVNSMLKDLGLEETKNLKVGSPLHKFISGGQRKRLNIALELIREPAVLFLDEPTSGLSSSDSEKVMNLLKEQTYKGRLIIVNIHQPSSDIFKLFDRLWILDKGGYPVYDGNPIEAVTYFKRAADYADAEVSMCSTCGNINPEIILNIIEEKAMDDSGRITQTRKVPPEDWHRKYLETMRTSPGEEEIREVPKTELRRPSRLRQFLIFLQRNIKERLADRQYMALAIIGTPLLAVIVAILTHYAPGTGYTVLENKNLVSYIFMSVIVVTFAGLSISAEEILKDRALLKREKFLRLSKASYLWSKILYVTGISIVQSLLFILVGNTIMGIGSAFWIWWTILFLASLLAGLTGLILSQSLRSAVAIYITVPMLLIPQILLCGLVVKFEDLTQRSATGNVPVIGDLIPSRWAYEALSVGYFAYNDYEKMKFDADRQKYQTLFYRSVFIDGLQSGLESADSISLETLRRNIPRLWSTFGIRPYTGIDSLNSKVFDSTAYRTASAWLDYARDTLASIGSEANMDADRPLTEYISYHGRDALLALYRNNCNKGLEQLLTGSGSETAYRITDCTIVPETGQVWIDPISRNGRAPFYSSVKILGRHRIDTVLFNCSVLMIMCIIAIVLLFADFGEKLTSEKNRK